MLAKGEDKLAEVSFFLLVREGNMKKPQPNRIKMYRKHPTEVKILKFQNLYTTNLVACIAKICMDMKIKSG